MVSRAVLAGEMLSQLVARVAGGDTIHSAAVALGLKPGSVGMRARRDPIFRKQLDDAAASRGRSPGSKRGARDTHVLIGSLQAGSSLAEACLAAGISMSGLYYRRSKDADFDRTIHALLSRKARFDAAGKEAALAQISRGSSLSEAIAHAGVRSRSTFWRHLKSDAAFAAAVHAAQGGYGEIGGRVAPTKAKVKFERLLDVLPFSRSLDDACSVVGLSVPAFRGLIARCERRRTAYFAAVDKLPGEGRGKRALRNGRVDSDLYAVVDHIRDGMSLSQALRLVGITYPMFMRRRRRRPQLEQALVNAGHRTTSLGRRQMDDVDQQVAVLAKLTEGVPLYGLGWFNLPNGATVSQYAQEKPDFRALLVSALREGGERRRGYPSARINAALEAIAAGAGYAGAAGGLRLAAGAYSPRAIDLFNRALDERIARQGQEAALAELAELAGQEPAVSALYREAAARLSRATGAAGATGQNQTIRQLPDGSWEVDINQAAVAPR